jgi:hypothetical protein
VRGERGRDTCRRIAYLRQRIVELRDEFEFLESAYRDGHLSADREIAQMATLTDKVSQAIREICHRVTSYLYVD